MTTEPEAEQPNTERPEVTEVEAEEQAPPGSRQERRDEHVRERLRETEAERDRLRDRLDARDRREVEAHARSVLGEKGANLFRYDLADLRDEDGNVDLERVEQALEPIRAALQEGRASHHGDIGPRRTAPMSKGASWSQVLGGRGRG